MKYRKLDANGDYLFGGEGQFFVDDPAGVAQAIQTRLLLMTNEWFLDSNEGTPYDESIRGYGTAATRDPAIIDRILGTPGVQSLLQYSSSLDGDRRFQVSARVATLFGEVQVTASIGAPPPPAPSPPPPSLATGWHNPLIGSDPSSAAHANSGTGNWSSFPNLNGGSLGRLHVSLVNYTSGTVVWSMDWQPIDEFQDTPTLEPGDVESTVLVNMGNMNGPLDARGLLTVTATVNGNLVDAGVEFACDDAFDFYPPCAWGPAP